MQVKTIKDYYEIIYSKFPEVSKQDIKRILNYGWKSLYLHNSYGGDVFLSDKNLWCYIGFLKRNSLQYFAYYKRKLRIKIRVLYRRKKIPWDGYYYFALTEKQYENYLAQMNKRGRKRKKFNYGNIILYKIKEECKVIGSNRKYIFRVPYLSDFGFAFYKPDFTTDKAELIETRDIQKFKDILVSNNKQEFYA